MMSCEAYGLEGSCRCDELANTKMLIETDGTPTIELKDDKLNDLPNSLFSSEPSQEIHEGMYGVG